MQTLSIQKRYLDETVLMSTLKLTDYNIFTNKPQNSHLYELKQTYLHVIASILREHFVSHCGLVHLTAMTACTV